MFLPLIGCRPVLMVYNICFFHCCKGSDYFSNQQIKSHLFLNKMYFYCFLPSSSTDFTDFTDFFDIITWRTRWTRRLAQCVVWLNLVHLVFFIINGFRWFHGFNYLCNLCNLLTTIVAHSGTRTWCHALPWWALCCSLSSRTAAASKQKYLDYDVFPPVESNHRKAMPGAGWVGVISSLSIPRNSISDHAARCRVLHTIREAPHRSLLSAHS